MSFLSLSNKLSRRRFITGSAALVAGTLVAAPLQTMAARSRHHAFSFYHTHTGETLRLDFNVQTGSTDNTTALDHFLRDFRTGDIHPIDTRLLAILYKLQREANSSGTVEVISGFRSPATNAKLQKAGRGVAKKSFHMQGMAIDIRLSDIETHTLAAIARSLQEGGVGYYAKPDFIHLDTGRVRSW